MQHEMRTPAQILQKVNDQLTSERKSAMFVTAVVALLNPEDGTLVCANAGHNPPMILRNKKGKVERIPHGGIALGVTEDCQLKDYSTTLAPGDSFLLYTDGLTEANSPNGEIFGEDRLTSILRRLINIQQVTCWIKLKMRFIRSAWTSQPQMI